MNDEGLAARFEGHREHLLAVAFRMLGSASEAEDAVQEAWLHVARGDATVVQNLGGWLTTIVARVCLDMLRSRKARREDAVGAEVPEPGLAVEAPDPEKEWMLADSVGLALLVVLETLPPAERLAFVLHEMFGLPFDEIAPIVGRSEVAARQLASRARRRVRGGSTDEPELRGQRRVVGAFLAAMRAGDLEALVRVLDPKLAVRADGEALHDARGARGWAEKTMAAGRGARAASPALIDGAVGVVVAPRGKLFRVLRFTIEGERIVAVDVVSAPAQLQALRIQVLDEELAR